MLLAKDMTQGEISLIKHAEDVYDFCKEESKKFNLTYLKQNLNDIIFSYHNKEIKGKILDDVIDHIFKEASIFHDIGKVNPEVQEFFNNKTKKTLSLLDFEENETLKKYQKKKFITHQKISYILYDHFIQTKKYEDLAVLKEIVKYLILYHHAKNFNDLGDYEKQPLSLNFPDEDFKKSDFQENIKNFLKEIDENYKTSYLENYCCDDFKIKQLSSKTYLPFKEYGEGINIKKIKFEAVKTFFRLLFNNSDREVSKNYLKEEVNKNFNENEKLDENFKEILKNFEAQYDINKRTEKQNEIIDNLLEANNDIFIVDGAPGCGKTRIYTSLFIKENLKEKKQMFVITPRNTIGMSTYEQYKDEKYFKNKGNINLSFEIINSEFCEKTIFNNGKKEIITEDNFEKYNSDIVFMSVDHLIKLYNDVHNQQWFNKILKSLIIFDEYHEIYQQDLLQVFFGEILNVLKLFNTKTILLSGTPNLLFTKQYIEIEEKNILTMNSFNYKTINIHFKKNKNITEIIKEKELKNFIAISNTAIEAQKNGLSVLNNLKDVEKENFFIFHSKYEKKQKEELLKTILKSFGVKNNKMLFSGPIIQSSLDITTNIMLTEDEEAADNILQRIGRLNRFGDYEKSDLYITKENINKGKIDSFSEYVKIAKNEEDFETDLNELREFYKKYFDHIEKNPEQNKLFISNLDKIFKNAQNIFVNLSFTPLKPFNKDKKDKEIEENRKIIAKNFGLRGESGIFIAPPLLTIQELNKLNLNNITFENNIVLSINKNYIIDNNNFKPNFIDKIKKDYDKILKTELYSEFYTQYNEFFNVSSGKKTKKLY